MRLDVANPTQEGDQGEGESRVGAVLTVVRRCGRGRPVGGVASVFRAAKAFTVVQMSLVV
jgi:hypothetical protein